MVCGLSTALPLVPGPVSVTDVDRLLGLLGLKKSVSCDVNPESCEETEESLIMAEHEAGLALLIIWPLVWPDDDTACTCF